MKQLIPCTTVKISTTGLEDMEVFVPSRSRPTRSLTLEALTMNPANRWPNIYLVVPASQARAYAPLAKKHGVVLLPCPANGIAGTRQWIGEQAEDSFLMIDDDLRFYKRGPRTNDAEAESVRLYKFDKNDMWSMLHYVSRLLDEKYKHVAISAREGNNRLPIPFVRNSRPLRVLGYRKKEFLACAHGRVAIMEDFDVTLQLIEQGYPNCVVTEYAQDQPMTQMAGGCSDYRTHKLHEANVKKMALLHPGLVKTRLKENKTGGEFGTRLEATIYWEKAHKGALAEVI